MGQTVLITGGAGFIGSHLADELLAHGYRVHVLDNLAPQVHGDGATRPSYLDDRATLSVGDVRDPKAVSSALVDADIVVHFAAAVGVGQSMYEICNYTSTNAYGTAVLLEALAKRPVKKLLVASSMSIYGEGRYQAENGELYDEATRSAEQLRAARWEPTGNSGRLRPVATPEGKKPSLSSIYALSKYDQERMCLLAGSAFGIDAVALRFFNTYGPRQALSNPYTGVLAIFAARLLNGKRPIVFEDGEQRRDFVSVHDVARACRLALEAPRAAGSAINIGSGYSVTVNEVAARLAAILDKTDLTPELTGRYRVGDIRHCFADVRLAQELLGYTPRVGLDAGLSELAKWLEGQKPVDRTEQARRELDARGLTI
jgi:dTDP-L-rhamnose 4-epimerase